MKMLARALVIIVAATSAAHCDKNKKKGGPEVSSGVTAYSEQTGPDETDTGEEAPTAAALQGFIPAQVLRGPGNYRSTSSSDIVSIVSLHSYFYRTSIGSVKAQGCLGQIMAQQKYTVKQDKFSAKFFEANLVSCFQADPDFASLKITKATLNFLHEGICPGADLKRFDGASVANAQAYAKPAECLSEIFNLSVMINATLIKGNSTSLVTRTVNIARIGDGQIPVPGVAAAPAALTLTEGEAAEKPTTTTKDGDGAMGCLYTATGDNKQTSKGCQWISSTVDYWVPAAYPDNQYIQIVDQDLAINSPAEGPYYAGGRMLFLINGWKGSMVYTAPYEQPTWNASYGANNVASGTFGTAVPKPTPRADATNPPSAALKLGEAAAAANWSFLDLAASAIYRPFKQ
ncbi:MAG: hypothetical protein FJ146_10270 [Deltaproteobacteria bacterium]|nr:hypothetical protein [Deltaproteobacteria bacterium]